ncbi:MAG: autotransporter outer membrane beta-barrel domain-containing protein, partial [Castellaniella sp.]|uniref:autotransporter outer membrane beta-barrel domain-containing protein n=1 Tax=Castellaniella sp. TaxID=1955812 RepID=UPI003A868AFA
MPESKQNTARHVFTTDENPVNGKAENIRGNAFLVTTLTAALMSISFGAQAGSCAPSQNGTYTVNQDGGPNPDGCEISSIDPEIGNSSEWSRGFYVYSKSQGSDMIITNDLTTTIKGYAGIRVRQERPDSISTFDAAGKTINLTIKTTDGNSGKPEGDNLAKLGVSVHGGGIINIGTLNLTMRDLPTGDDGSNWGLGKQFQHYGVVTGSSVNSGESDDTTFNQSQSKAIFDNLNIDMQAEASGGFLSTRYPLLVGIRAIQGAVKDSGNGSAGYVEVKNDLTINLDATSNDAIGIYVSGSGNDLYNSEVRLNNSDITIKSTSIRANAIRLGKTEDIGTGVGSLYSSGHMNIDTTQALKSPAIDLIWQGALLDAGAASASTTILSGNSAIRISGDSSQATAESITNFNNLRASTTSITANLVEVAEGQNQYTLNVTGADSLLTAAQDGYLVNVAGTAAAPSTMTFNLSDGAMSGLLDKTTDATLNIDMARGATWNLVEKASGATTKSTFSALDMQSGSTVNAFNKAGTSAFILQGDVRSNASILSMSDGKIGDILTIDGNYTGDEARLLVDSNWNDPDDQHNDLMIITGTADGKTTVSAPHGIIGDVTLSETPKNGQWLAPVVTVQGTDLNKSGTFVGAAETTNAGQAQLVQRDSADGSSYYWTLAAKTPNPDPDPTPDPDPKPDPIPIYTPGTSGYVQMSRIDRETGLEQLGKLHERVSEQQTGDSNASGATANNDPHPVWGRLNVTDLKEQGEDRFGYATKDSFIQFGTDLRVRTDEERNHQHLGVMVTYSRGDHDFYDRYRAENGVVTDRKHVGTGTTDMYSLGAYSTWYSANGAYLDLVGNLSGIHNTYDSGSGSASQNGYGLGVSVEVGHPWQLGRSAWQIEPQAQLSYQYVHLNDFDDDVRTIDDQSGGTLRGRLGARLAYNNDNGEQRTHTFYVTANVLHDFTGN